MNLRSILFAAAMPLVTACTSSVTDTTEQPDIDVDLEGSTGIIPIEFPWGVQSEHYRIVDGFVVIRGDIIVKRSDQLHERSTARVGGRWPDAEVRFAFDDNYPAAEKTTVRTAVAALELELPIDFIEIANPCDFGDACATDYILMRIWDDPTTQGGQSATPSGAGQVGHLGGQQIINSELGFSTSGFHHEFLHAIGMYHEQERNDRDTYVQFRSECVKDDDDNPDASAFIGNFNKNANPAVDFGTYDFTSIMQYTSNTFALEEPAQSQAPCNDRWPLERITGSCPLNVCSDLDGNGSREFIGQLAKLSANDVDAVWSMYAKPLGAHEAGDAFGQVIVAGDFDDDGREDLAMGAPGENTVSNTVVNAGAVMLFKGTEDGFQPWKTITQTTIGANEEASDGFGSALAVGDFDDDGIDDLAIGTPGESVGSDPDGFAGAVYLMHGTKHGLDYWRSVTQANISANVEGGDRFGTALAVGDFSGDGIDDLAVGSPGETHGDGISAGHVYVLRGTGTSSALAAWSDVGQESLSVAPNAAPGGVIPPPTPLGSDQSSDMFGATLAAGRIDGDAIDDLVVGAHCDSEVAPCAGGAYLYRGAAAGMRGWMRVAQGTGSDAHDRFGWSVATGDVDMDGDDDVLIGAPYDDYNGVADVGRVYVAKPSGHVIASNGVLSQTGTGSDAGASDHFGASIAFGNNGAFDVIAIGARNEAWGAGAASGAVFVFNASDGANIGFQQTLGAAPASDELAEDAFGTTIAVYTDGGRDYLIVGNPQEDGSAGVAQVFEASPAGTDFAQAQLLRQTTKGTRAP